MTVEEKFKQMLCEHGMFEEQAEAVLKIAKQSATNKAWDERWDDDMDGYPKEALYGLVYGMQEGER